MQNFRSPELGQNQFIPGQFGTQQMGSQLGLQQQNWQQQGQGQGQTASFGAHETMEAHEVLSSMIEGINRFNLYKQFIQDPQLNSIMDNQLRHMNQTYENIASYLHNRGSISSMPYHGVRKPSIQYGLRNPSPMQPSSNPQNLTDRDVAMGMLSYHKSSALISTLATLECADSTLRRLMQDSANSCMNEAWECFVYMNQKGMYQVPTMQQNTTNTMVNSFQ